MEKIVTGSELFFSGIEGFEPHDHDRIQIMEADDVNFLFKRRMFDRKDNTDTFYIVRQPKDVYIKWAVKFASGTTLGMFLTTKFCEVFGITIDELFGREPKAVSFPAQPPFPWPDDGVLRVLLYAGHTWVYGPVEGADEIHFCYEGPALNIESAVSVYCDDVMGNVTAGGDAHCPGSSKSTWTLLNYRFAP